MQLIHLQNEHSSQLWRAYEAVFAPARHKNRLWTEAELASELARGHTWGFFDGHELVGFVVAAKAVDHWEILSVGVDFRCRQRGLGTQMLQQWLGLAQLQHDVFLEVHHSNQAAIRLYQKMGFTLSGERPNYYPDGGKALILVYKCR